MRFLAVPVATYRIQFSLNFRFVNARDLVPYLHELGITDLYVSPRFKAGRGSSHGYDVADPQRINSELGTEEEFDELVRKLKSYGMGLLLDIVPNHMVASSENPWWMDVLENGPESLYAGFFDIDWHPVITKAAFLQENKVLLPVLDDLYGNVLENQELNLKLDENGLYVRYHDHRFPLNLRSYGPVLEHCLSAGRAAESLAGATVEELDRILDAVRQLLSAPSSSPDGVTDRQGIQRGIKDRLWNLYHRERDLKACLDDTVRRFNGRKGAPKTFEPLDQLMTAQFYRLAYWRTASEEINYRRFFDVNDLVGLRVEDPKVFDERHRHIIELIKKEGVTGLRVDHVDGLYDPHRYLDRLQAQVTSVDGEREPTRHYIVVEKILGRNEPLPHDWPVAGTTGYDFLNALNGLFVDPEGLRMLEQHYRRFTGSGTSFGEVAYDCNKEVMRQLFSGETFSIGHALGRLAARDRRARDVPMTELVQALIEVTACLPVYRTYVRNFNISSRDRAYLERGIQAARDRMPRGTVSDAALDFLWRLLLLEPPSYAPELREEWLGFLMRWQQLTGPVMAKGAEDTAAYIYNPLISLNEVGGDCLREEPPFDSETFHLFNQDRLAGWPGTLNASSTHDTKRSEDVRLRIDVLSELHEVWVSCWERWSQWNRPKRQNLNGQSVPDAAEEVLLYQTMLGAWPLDPKEEEAFTERLLHFARKSLREAKVHTSWINPDLEYESAVETFIKRITDNSEKNRFWDDFLSFQRQVAFWGHLNALAQTLLKVTAPGVPDFYQGTELWDFSLVDPDNRRPVHFEKRVRLLEALRSQEARDREALLADLRENWQDGRIKLYLISKALNFRRAREELFTAGDYIPVYASHGKRENVFAFLRRRKKQWAIIASGRLFSQLAPEGQFPITKVVWKNARLILPAECPSRWSNVVTGEVVETRSVGRGKALPLSAVFARLPVALLEPISE